MLKRASASPFKGFGCSSAGGLAARLRPRLLPPLAAPALPSLLLPPPPPPSSSPLLLSIQVAPAAAAAVLLAAAAAAAAPSSFSPLSQEEPSLLSSLPPAMLPAMLSPQLPPPSASSSYPPPSSSSSSSASSSSSPPPSSLSASSSSASSSSSPPSPPPPLVGRDRGNGIDQQKTTKQTKQNQTKEAQLDRHRAWVNCLLLPHRHLSIPLALFTYSPPALANASSPSLSAPLRYHRLLLGALLVSP